MKGEFMISDRKNLFEGDTIVEVLIAISIAAFVMGTSYGIANKSIQKAISARERNQAVNVSQSQISALKLLYKNKTDISSFNSAFGVPDSECIGSAPCSPANAHFCLQDTGGGNWVRKDNNITNISQLSTLTVGNPGYAAECLQNGDYIDIFSQVTTPSKNSFNRTVYAITVTWAQVGSNTANQSTIYYRF